jgi:hypothetical protein
LKVDSPDMRAHVCTPGCLVKTTEFYVCSVTGECVTPVMLVTSDPHDGSQLVRQTASSGDYADVCDNDKNSGKLLALQVVNHPQKNLVGQLEFMTRVTREVVDRVMTNWNDNARLDARRNNALKEALKQMNATLRQTQRSFGFGIIAQGLSNAYQTYMITGGKYLQHTAPSHDFLEHCVRRVTQICTRVVYTSDCKHVTKDSAKYFSLAVLYTLKDGIRQEDIYIIQPERLLQTALPDLSDLALFNFQKSKFTDALKRLQLCMQKKISRRDGNLSHL